MAIVFPKPGGATKNRTGTLLNRPNQSSRRARRTIDGPKRGTFEFMWGSEKASVCPPLEPHCIILLTYMQADEAFAPLRHKPTAKPICKSTAPPHLIIISAQDVN